jgi:hypothetical protein
LIIPALSNQLPLLESKEDLKKNSSTFNGRTYTTLGDAKEESFSLIHKIILMTAILFIPLSFLFIKYGIRLAVYIVDRCFIDP